MNEAVGNSPVRNIVYALLAVLTAVLLVLEFPKFDLRFLAPISLTPLLFVVARTWDPWKRFYFGWLSGIVYWFFICTWIQFTLEHHGGMGTFGSWGAFLLFCLLKALHLAVFSLLAGPLMRRWYAIPATAALWVGLERTHATFGFAWLDLGNAGIDMSLPLRLAPFLGVYGISFVFCMMAAAIACVLLKRPRLVLAPLAILLLLWLLPALPENVAAPEQALVLQPNIDPDTDWTPLLQDRVEQRMTLLSNALPAPLVIWPELPAPLYYYDDLEFRQYARTIAAKHGAFLFETVAFTGEHQPLNSAVMIDNAGRELGRYDQINLVPFGEFVPPLFSWVNRITKETSDFVPGHDIVIFKALGHRYGTFICYESAFPALVRQFSKRGADVLVNLSNDSYFGHSEARLQHLLLARMRAVENDRFVIRATDNGITAVIDPAGRLRKVLPQFREVAALLNYGAVQQPTFYAEHGDWFAWGCLIVSVPLAAFLMFQNRRRADSSS